MPNTLPACGTAWWTRCREIMLHYFSHSFPRPPGVPRLGLCHPARLGGLLDVQSLDGEAMSLFVQAASSQSSYAAGKRRYLLFCARANLNPLPATEATLCRFVAHLSTEGLRVQSISGYLSAVRHLSIEAGLPPLAREGCPCLAYVLKGVSRSQGGPGDCQLPRESFCP